jgi:hypothetical protein
VTPGAQPIAQRLDDAEIEAVSAYFAGLSDDASEEAPP